MRTRGRSLLSSDFIGVKQSGVNHGPPMEELSDGIERVRDHA